jgi:hypothetical protein
MNVFDVKACIRIASDIGAIATQIKVDEQIPAADEAECVARNTAVVHLRLAQNQMKRLAEWKASKQGM